MSHFLTLQKLSWPTAQLYPGLCGYFSISSLLGVRYVDSRNTFCNGLLQRLSVFTLLRAGDQPSTVSISNHKTALWMVLAGQSCHPSISLRNTPPCNASSLHSSYGTSNRNSFDLHLLRGTKTPEVFRHTLNVVIFHFGDCIGSCSPIHWEDFRCY